MATVNFNGGLPAELTPIASQTVTNGNYINFQDSSFDAWTQQYLPDLYEAEVERYGNRMICSLLRMTGAEMPLESDQVIWTEQGRLHLSYENMTLAAEGGTQENVLTPASGTHAVRKNQTVVISDGTNVAKAIVTEGIETSTASFKVSTYGNAVGLVDEGFSIGAGHDVFVFGSEFGKGTDGMDESISPDVHTFENKPIILKDKFSVSGSDATQIGWIEVTGEAGQNGYLWYLKGEGDTRTRFDDYCEMSMVESTNAVTGSAATDIQGAVGTQGLFDALENRGIVAGQAFDAAADLIADFDEILKELDKQGSIEENMLFLNRKASITVDNGLATANSYGAGGTSYGVFQNSEDMALNLGFSGFRRGSYDFYKSDWKYLNNYSTRGLFEDIEGVLIPAGTTSTYDQNLGKNVRRPFLHVRYRSSGNENRKMKSWVIGSVGGTANSSIDDMNVHFLSERCLVTQAANNFVLFKNA